MRVACVQARIYTVYVCVYVSISYISSQYAFILNYFWWKFLCIKERGNVSKRKEI